MVDSLMAFTGAPMQNRTFASLWASVFLAAVTAGYPASAGEQPLSARDIFEAVSPNVCVIHPLDSTGMELGVGSGFRLDINGRIATNFHVIKGAHSARVRCAEKESVTTTVVAYSVAADLAILSIDSRGTAVTLNGADSIPVGAEVYVIGSPLGFDGSITSGLASGMRKIEGRDLLQISAPISPGNSGGPVTDGQGRVIGIAVGSLTEGQNINFAVPVRVLIELRDNPTALPKLAEAISGSKAKSSPNTESAPEREAAVSMGDFRKAHFGQRCDTIARDEVAADSVTDFSDEIGRKVSDIEQIRRGIARFTYAHGIERVGNVVQLTRGIAVDGFRELQIQPSVLANDKLYGQELSVEYYCDTRGRLFVGRYLWFRTDFDSIEPFLDFLLAVRSGLVEKYGVPVRDWGQPEDPKRKVGYRTAGRQVAWELDHGRVEIRFNWMFGDPAPNALEIQYVDLSLLKQALEAQKSLAKEAL